MGRGGRTKRGEREGGGGVRETVRKVGRWKEGAKEGHPEGKMGNRTGGGSESDGEREGKLRFVPSRQSHVPEILVGKQTLFVSN